MGCKQMELISKNKIAALLALSLGSGLLGVANAETVTIPHTFSANTAAKASEVNENFNALKSAIDTQSEQLDKQYDIADYFDSVSSTKTLASRVPVGQTPWTDSLEFTKSGEDIRRTYTSTITGSNYKTTDVFNLSADGIYKKKTISYDSSNLDTEEGVNTYSNNLYIPRKIKLGQTWGGNVGNISYENIADSSKNYTDEFFIQANLKTLVSVENMDIAGQTYECLVIATVNSTTTGTTNSATYKISSSYNSYRTYCKGIGLVRWSDKYRDDLVTAIQ